MVARRTAEIGIRMALGASRAAIVRLVLSDCAVLVGCGLTFGLAMALLVTRPLAAFLVAALPASDAVSFVGSALLLLLAALLASWNPARRATRVAPATALRTD
jgi:putative ABC transport system permease protein